MQTIRKIIFGIFGIFAVLFLCVGVCVLDKKQRKKMEILLESIAETVEEFKEEVLTIEDDIFVAETELTKEDFVKGTNKDLSIECRICGENTPRGKYFTRRNEAPDSQQPYAFICRECYHSLPADKEEWLEAHFLFRNDIVVDENEEAIGI